MRFDGAADDGRNRGASTHWSSFGDAEMFAPAGALADIVIPDISNTDDEHLWVPQADCLSFRPLCLCVSQGYYVNLLRFKGGGTLSTAMRPLSMRTPSRVSGDTRSTHGEPNPAPMSLSRRGGAHTLIVGQTR